MADAIKQNVTPVNEITFGVCMTGRPTDTEMKTATYTVVKDAESLSISIDGTIEEWNPMDQAGWVRRIMTAKSLGISMGGNRNYGDPGNDYVLTDDDKTAIARMAIELMPVAEEGTY